MEEKTAKTLVTVAALAAAVSLVVLAIDYQIKNEILRRARRLNQTLEVLGDAHYLERMGIPDRVPVGDGVDYDAGIPTPPVVPSSSAGSGADFTIGGHGISVNGGAVSTGRFSPQDEPVDADQDPAE